MSNSTTKASRLIFCKVQASNYRGVLVSNTLGPIGQLVTVEYRGFADTYLDDYIAVYAVQAYLFNLFNAAFDQNFDDNPDNDFMGYCLSDRWDAIFASPLFSEQRNILKGEEQLG